MGHLLLHFPSVGLSNLVSVAHAALQSGQLVAADAAKTAGGAICTIAGGASSVVAKAQSLAGGTASAGQATIAAITAKAGVATSQVLAEVTSYTLGIAARLPQLM